MKDAQVRVLPHALVAGIMPGRFRGDDFMRGSVAQKARAAGDQREGSFTGGEDTAIRFFHWDRSISRFGCLDTEKSATASPNGDAAANF
jgi:hypothetical protein